MISSNLSSFSSDSFPKGASKPKQILWFLVNALFVRASWNPFMGVKIYLLRLFGAHIGNGFVIKNNVVIKFPWKLFVGDHVWLGEYCWIDNLDEVKIGNNVCISQGALLLTGNHDYCKSDFPYRNAPIVIEDGVWIGAKAVVCPGVLVATHSVLSVGAIVTRNTEAWGVYQGNPAVKVKERIIKN